MPNMTATAVTPSAIVAPTSPGAAHDAAALRRWQRNGRGSVQDEYRANAEYARRIASYYERR